MNEAWKRAHQAIKSGVRHVVVDPVGGFIEVVTNDDCAIRAKIDTVAVPNLELLLVHGIPLPKIGKQGTKRSQTLSPLSRRPGREAKKGTRFRKSGRA